MSEAEWIVCQIGAREHYAIPRALAQQEQLRFMITDFWVSPKSPLAKIVKRQRLKDRWHSDLEQSKVTASNLRTLSWEGFQKVRRHHGWQAITERNKRFQVEAIRMLERWTDVSDSQPTLFCYSYAAGELFGYAKAKGWKTILGQIDPGPEEERIVIKEHERFKTLESSWEPAPKTYWQEWWKEIELADRIVVNSTWSKNCLISEGVREKKIGVLPLVYDEKDVRVESIDAGQLELEVALRVLFLGQITLRKGIGRHLEAMKILREEPIELTLVGPTEINPSAWESLPKVHWRGPVPRSQTKEFFHRADLFILPTLSDGYALTQLEALSFETPVLASANCGEAVCEGDNGWILEDLEPETIARQLTEIASAGPLLFKSIRTFDLDQLGTSLVQLAENI